MSIWDKLKITSTDVIAAGFIAFYIICKLNRIDTSVDASVAMIIAFYFGSKHVATLIPAAA